MNSNSAVATSAAAVSGAMIGGVVVYFFQLLHMTPPPADVAGTIGAILIGGGHAIVNWLSVRFPAPAVATPVVVSAAPAVNFVAPRPVAPPAAAPVAVPVKPATPPVTA